MVTSPPHWDLTNVYTGLDAPALVKDIDWIKTTTETLQKLYQEKLTRIDTGSSTETINEAISEMVDQMNALMEKAYTIRAYLHSFVSTDFSTSKPPR